MQPSRNQARRFLLAAPRDVDRLASPNRTAGKIKVLAATIAAIPRARDSARSKRGAPWVAVNLVAGDDVEGERQKRVTSRTRWRVVVFMPAWGRPRRRSAVVPPADRMEERT